MMSVMCPFAGNERFPKSVCNALIDSMDRRFLHIFKKYYADHALLHDLSATFQRGCFWKILATVQTTKDEVQSISAIACDSISGQAFAANAFASQAKLILDHYSQGGGYTSGNTHHSNGGYRFNSGCSDSLRRACGKLGQGDKCFGCGAPHPYIWDEVIMCLNKDQPGICAAAKKNYQEWLAKSRKGNKKRKDKPLNYNTLNERDKALVREGVLVSMCVLKQRPDEASMITTDSSRASDRKHNSPPSKQAMMTIIIIDVLVLSSASHTTSILLAPIVTSFPHIHLQLGTKLDCPRFPDLRCVVNTATALSTPIVFQRSLCLKTTTLSSY
jgi:hypothetical protein